MTKELLGSLELNRIYQRDCLSDGGMALIPDKSIDMILCDLPYGTTACKWDTIIPFDMLWAQYERIIKDNGAIVLTASQPFTSLLVASNTNLFRHSWVWNKKAAANVMNAKYSPLKIHEDVVVFSKKRANYFPQMVKGKPRIKGGHKERENIYGKQEAKKGVWSDEYYPKSILEYSNASKKDVVHPTQKPVDLFAYLIRTYTNEGDIVLDNCMGSGTTAVAALNTNRKFIGFETEPAYIEIANKRIDDLR
jgi:site-specific DNA-methyltransferase (adenine-specific)